MIQLFGQYENRKCGKGWKKDMIFKRMHNKPFAFFDSHVFIVLPIAKLVLYQFAFSIRERDFEMVFGDLSGYQK